MSSSCDDQKLKNGTKVIINVLKAYFSTIKNVMLAYSKIYLQMTPNDWLNINFHPSLCYAFKHYFKIIIYQYILTSSDVAGSPVANYTYLHLTVLLTLIEMWYWLLKIFHNVFSGNVLLMIYYYNFLI